MSKEQVIVFDGEQNFIAPKTRVANKFKGKSVHVPEELNVIAPPSQEVIEQPTQGGSVNTEPTVLPTNPTATGGYGGRPQPIIDPTKGGDVTLGGARTTVVTESTSSTTSTTTAAPKKIDVTLLTPPNLGLAPMGGGGGGGGQEEAAPPVEEKTNYLWILLAIGAIAYFFSKKK